ncbi:MAG: hypothetical protein ABIF19_08300, partial [Planctomycetota bacterium]
MPKQKSRCNHYGDENVALPGHKCKDAAFALHWKNSIQIPIDYAEKSEMVNKETADKSYRYDQKGMSRPFG